MMGLNARVDATMGVDVGADVGVDVGVGEGDAGGGSYHNNKKHVASMRHPPRCW